MTFFGSTDQIEIIVDCAAYNTSLAFNYAFLSANGYKMSPEYK